MRYLALAGMTLLLTTGCGRDRSDETGGVGDTATASTTTPVAPAADTAVGVREFTYERRQEFTQSVRPQLADIDQRIRDLAAQAKSRGGAVSDRALANIRTSRRSIERNLGRVEAATAANWEQIRETVNQGLDNLNESIEAAQPK